MNSLSLAPLAPLAPLIPLDLLPVSRLIHCSPKINNEKLGTIDFTRVWNPCELSDPGWRAFHNFQKL